MAQQGIPSTKSSGVADTAHSIPRASTSVQKIMQGPTNGAALSSPKAPHPLLGAELLHELINPSISHAQATSLPLIYGNG